MKIIEFNLEESKKNKGSMMLVATDENGQKWAIAGDPYQPSFAQPYEQCWNLIPDEKSEKQ